MSHTQSTRGAKGATTLGASRPYGHSKEGVNRVSIDSINVIENKSSRDSRSTTVVLRDSSSKTDMCQPCLTEKDLDAFVVEIEPADGIATIVWSRRRRKLRLTLQCPSLDHRQRNRLSASALAYVSPTLTRKRHLLPRAHLFDEPFSLSLGERSEQDIPGNSPAETMQTTLQTSTSLLLLLSLCSARQLSLLLPGLDRRRVEVALLETLSSTRPRRLVTTLAAPSGA